MSAAHDGADQHAVDRTLLDTYLNDHLVGAVAGSRRLRRTADTLARTPVGRDLDRVAREVAEEREELRRIIGQLGFAQTLPKQVGTWLAERVSRLKANGRLIRSSPLTALLELELLRSAVMGKRGLWQTLSGLAGEIGLDPAEPSRLLAQTEEQLAVLDRAHAYVRARALRG